MFTQKINNIHDNNALVYAYICIKNNADVFISRDTKREDHIRIFDNKYCLLINYLFLEKLTASYNINNNFRYHSNIVYVVLMEITLS